MLLIVLVLVVVQQQNNVGILVLVEVGVEGFVDDGYINVDKLVFIGKLDVLVECQLFFIEIVDWELMEDIGVKNIQDVLFYSFGVYVGNFGFDMCGDFVKVWGLEFFQYLDGLCVSYGNYIGVWFNIYVLESVEILKGFLLVLYG